MQTEQDSEYLNQELYDPALLQWCLLWLHSVISNKMVLQLTVIFITDYYFGVLQKFITLVPPNFT